MSDKYEIDGVTITHQGGGYYELSHPSLAEPIRERGKEVAEAKAAEIAKANKSDDEATIPPQGAVPPVGPTPRDEQLSDDERAERERKNNSGDSDKDDEIAQLKAQLAQKDEDLTKLTKASENVVKTVETISEPTPPNQVPADIPRQFRGEMDAKAKAALKKMGMGVTKIVLEENESIPPTGLFVGHNGRSYMIMPGEEVDVPDFLLNVLDDAIMATAVTDSKTQKVLGFRNRSKYPYRRVQ